jgi:hypothetical protein
MVLQTAPLLRLLPNELVLDISDILPPDAMLALKLTHPRLNAILSLEARLTKTTLSACERLAIIDHLKRPNAQPTHLRCIICKQRYLTSLFKSRGIPEEIPLSFADKAQRSEFVGLPQRLCLWEVGRLMRIINTGPDGLNKWVTRKDVICLCCGSIKSWKDCDCRCATCLSASVRVYTRYLPKGARVEDSCFEDIL